MEASAVPRLAPAGVSLLKSPHLLRLAPDSHLVALIREGRRGAFEAVYDRHHRGILSFCRHMLGDPQEAEDAVQHTFLSAYNDLISSRKQIHLRAWLFTIARNRCYSILRARREQPAADIDEAITEGLATQVQRRQDLRDLVFDMRRLPEEQRAALVLAELESLSHEQIGEALGVPREKVKALVFQARESLVASRAARETDCAEIREQLATQRGGGLRRANLRRHVRECAGCRDFKRQLDRQRRQLAILLPVAPTIALKEGVLGASIGGGTSVGIAGGSLVLSSALKSGLAKVVVGAVLAGVGTAGTIVATKFGSQTHLGSRAGRGATSSAPEGTAALAGPTESVETLPPRGTWTAREPIAAATGGQHGAQRAPGPATGGVSFAPPGSGWLTSIMRGATSTVTGGSAARPNGAASIAPPQTTAGPSGSGQHQASSPWDVLGSGTGIKVGQRSSSSRLGGSDGGYGYSATGRSSPGGSTRGQGGGNGSYSASSGSDGGGDPGTGSSSAGASGSGSSSGSGTSPASTGGTTGTSDGSGSSSGSTTSSGSDSSGGSASSGGAGTGDSNGAGGSSPGATGSGGSDGTGGASVAPHGDTDTSGSQPTSTSGDSGTGSSGSAGTTPAPQTGASASPAAHSGSPS